MVKENRITVRLQEGLREQLQRICKLTGLDEPTIIRACLEAFIERVETEGEIRLPLAIVSKNELSKKSDRSSSRSTVDYSLNERREKSAIRKTETPGEYRAGKKS